MRSYCQNFRGLLFCLALFLGAPSICFCQSVGGWTVEAPPNSVKLTTVSQIAPGVLKFLFENVSGKSIVELVIGDPEGAAGGPDGFLGGPGRGLVAPGGTVNAYFNTQNFSVEGQTVKKVRVDVIFYDDGSGFGDGSWKARMEDRMLGEALETKRDAELLAASPDPSISGFDKVEAQIRSEPLNATAEAVQLLRGVALPGISQALIESRLAHPSPPFTSGASTARWELLSVQIALIKSNDAEAMKAFVGSPQRAVEMEKRAHALSGLAKKYSSLTEWQAQYLKKVFQAED